MTSPLSTPLSSSKDQETARLVAHRLQQLEQQKKLEAAVTFLALLILAPIFFTLAWNYGISEIIQSLGGPDANINLLVSFLTLIGLRCIALQWDRRVD